MKKFLLGTVALLLISCQQGSIRELDKKNGFRETTFGMPPDSLKFGVMEFGDDTLKTYTKQIENKTIGDFEVDKIEYHFKHNKLNWIWITIEGKDNTIGILKMFQAKYGNGEKINNKLYIWEGEKVQMAFVTVSNENKSMSKIYIASTQFGKDFNFKEARQEIETKNEL